MIQIGHRDLSQQSLTDLASYQRSIDGLETYVLQVEAAKADWAAKRGNKPIREARTVLQAMCSGVMRCMYCEDARGEDIEHVHPKDLFPEYVFQWENYLLVCGGCNTKKNNKFKIVTPNAELIDITRARGAPIVRPISGDALMINPRFENPLDYMVLDIRDSFRFVPSPTAPKPFGRDRAEYTIAVLELNERGLPKIRSQAYGNFRARLREYVHARERGAYDQDLRDLIDSLLSLPQPTVWYEMKRQRERILELGALFAQAPQALAW